MAKQIFAPPGTTEVSFGGETYVVAEDGTVMVPESAAQVLLGSHGFALSLEKTRVITAKVAKDSDLVDDDDNDAPSPSDFSRPMTQQDMKSYLRSEGIGIPKGIMVGQLRTLVEDTYAAQLAAHKGEPVKTDATTGAV